jgi:D-alanyl-D-alanine carboxypeptidase
MQMRILLLALAGLVFARAQPQLPDTPAARQFSAWLTAFNDADPAPFQRFSEKNFPKRRGSSDQDRAFRKQTGGFDFIKAQQSTATRFTGLVKERNSNQFARVEIEVEPTEPHLIANFGLSAIDNPNEPPPSRMSESDLLAALRAKLDQEAAADRFSGAVLLAKNGQPIYTAAFGLADREKKVPNKLDTRFRIGSMNKMFTAVSILQLAQAGKIQLNDPLGKYLTGYPNKNVASKVTIHHLLTHTGGTGDFFGPQFDAHRLELRALQDYVTLYGNRDLAFEPGSRWEYSNYGFLLLGLVIEKVSGESYYDYVRDHVYQPAGMRSTDSLAEGEIVPDRSIGYMKEDSPTWQPNTDTLPPRGTSAGGGYSTVEDLLRFANALNGHKLLNEHYTELLTTGKVDGPGAAKYAYGFGDSVVNGVRWFGHGGGAPGMNGDLKIFPQSGYAIAVLANMDPPAASRISEFISSRLPASAAAVSSSIAGVWQGKLEDVPAVTVTVEDGGGKLSGTATFYRIVNDGSGPKAEGKNSAPLINPALDGKVFSFQVKNSKEELTSFKMELTAENEANLKGGKVIRDGEAEEAPPLKMIRQR